MRELLLQVRDLTVQLDRTSGATLDRVSFDIGAGEAVGLLGESGCGKTTLALALIGLLPPVACVTGGSVRFRGHELLLKDERQLQRIRGAELSIIFQEPQMALNPVMRVGDQIVEVLRAHSNGNRRRHRERAESLLQQVRLPDAHIYSAYPHELSGGECQRVVIAQALACKPALLIADEPTSALDTTTQADLLGLLKEIKERLNLALLFITHHPLLLSGIADRILIMYAGRIVEEGTLAGVTTQPHHPYTAALLRSIPPAPGKHVHARQHSLPAIPGAALHSKHVENGCPFEPRCPERMPVCATRAPRQVQTANGGRVRCFRHGG
jgi:peptide/nickel transport system ATP-binding protein